MASLDLPFAAFAPRAYDLEENDPMVRHLYKHIFEPWDTVELIKE